jgi:HSP20 family molecular chaperone IbpA
MSSQLSSRDPLSTPAALKFTPAQILIDQGREIHNLIERRAYELFECRGRAHGFDVDDWLWAESEVVHSCRHDLKESPEAIVLQAELPGSFTADQIEISVEPRRLMVSGERKVDVLYGSSKGTHSRITPQRIFRVHDLPVEIDPSRTTASLRGEMLEVVMPKPAAADRSVMPEPVS